LIAIYPPHDLEILPLLEQERYEEAQAKMDRVGRAMSPWQQKTGAVSGGYRQGKALLAALGHPVGDPRPPTLPCTEEDIAEAREIMEELGWIPWDGLTPIA
jgi:dihydrodipicolinate synthase/N-acetylneuraminate lyase